MLLVSLLFPIGLMCSYGSKNWTDFTLGLCHTNVALGGSDIDVSIFLLKYLGLNPCL